MNQTKEMKADAKKRREERGFRQDHATRGNNRRSREWDDRRDKVLISKRRDERRGAGELTGINEV